MACSSTASKYKAMLMTLTNLKVLSCILCIFQWTALPTTTGFVDATGRRLIATSTLTCRPSVRICADCAKVRPSLPLMQRHLVL